MTWRSGITSEQAVIVTVFIAPSTLGSFVRPLPFGHVSQLDAIASRFLMNLAGKAPLAPSPEDGDGELMLVDDDDTRSKPPESDMRVSALFNALLGTASTTTSTRTSNAQVAEVTFPAFTPRPKEDHIVGRLIVRRPLELKKKDVAHPALCETRRFDRS